MVMALVVARCLGPDALGIAATLPALRQAPEFSYAAVPLGAGPLQTWIVVGDAHPLQLKDGFYPSVYLFVGLRDPLREVRHEQRTDERERHSGRRQSGGKREAGASSG
jgi:hypothetical protein